MYWAIGTLIVAIYIVLILVTCVLPTLYKAAKIYVTDGDFGREEYWTAGPIVGKLWSVTYNIDNDEGYICFCAVMMSLILVWGLWPLVIIAAIVGLALRCVRFVVRLANGIDRPQF